MQVANCYVDSIGLQNIQLTGGHYLKIFTKAVSGKSSFTKDA